jgi:hypothetical protein
MKQTQNQFYGLDVNKARKATPGSIYVASDTRNLYVYDRNGDFIKVSSAATGTATLMYYPTPRLADINKPISVATQIALNSKAASNHNHLKADITDFDEADYADYQQGLLANSAIQPNDNISELNNDSEFLIESEVEALITLGIAEGDFYKELTYIGGDLSKIETWEDATKATKLFTKNLIYTTGSLTQITLTNETTSTTETKTLSYDNNENLINITKT